MTDATADLRTVSWGDPDAPNTALLVHGLTGRTDAFRALADELLSDGLLGWRLLSTDLRAEGRRERRRERPASRSTRPTSSRS